MFLWFIFGVATGMAILTAIAFIDAKIKKKKIKKMLEQSSQEAKAVYGFDITKLMKGDK